MSKEQQEKLDAALGYAKRGWSVIPMVGHEKEPPLNMKWKEYQSRIASDDEIRGWFELYPNMDIAIVTGRISGIVVVDVEKDGKADGLTPTVISKTGGGGFHFFYRYPGTHVSNRVRIREKMDIRGDGGYAVVPPSSHKSGGTYTWSVSPDNTDLEELPKWVLTKTAKANTERVADWPAFLSQINPEGQRNDTTARIAGKFLSAVPASLWDYLVWPGMKEWNQKCNQPPLEEQELRATYESICRTHLETMEDEYDDADLEPLSLQALYDMKLPPPEWRVEKLVPVEGITGISAAPGNFKTWLAIEIARCVAGGIPLFGHFKTKQTGVLYIEEELGRDAMTDRFKKFNMDAGLNFHLLSKTSFRIALEHIKKFVLWCKDRGVGLVIIDSLIRYLEGEENSAHDVAQMFKLLRLFVKDGISVITTQHNRKEGAKKLDDIRGSGDFGAAVLSQLSLSVSKSTGEITVRHLKSNLDEPVPTFQIKLIQQNSKFALEYVGNAPKKATPAKKIDKRTESIVKVFQSSRVPMTAQQVFYALDLQGVNTSISMVRRTLEGLTQSGDLRDALHAPKHSGNARYFELTQVLEKPDSGDG